MTTRTFTAVASIAVTLLGLFLAGCDDDPPLAPASDASRVRGLELTGPESVPPGWTEQFRLTARYVDGTGRDVTAEAIWHSADTSIVTVGADGRAQGVRLGETDIRASFLGRLATRHVIVLPPGTFKVSGIVRDANVGIQEARVDVTAGSAAGLSTLTFNGNYRLYGVSGPTEITVTKQSYQPHRQTLDVNRHLLVDVSLERIAIVPDPSGTYTLAIVAAPECRDALPEDARRRTYQTTISPGPFIPGFVISVEVSSEFAHFNSFFWYGRPDTTGLMLQTGEALGYYYYGPPLVERLGPSRYYALQSVNNLTKAVLSSSAAGLEGPLRATISIFDGDGPWYNARTVAECRSDNHRLTFTR